MVRLCEFGYVSSDQPNYGPEQVRLGELTVGSVVEHVSTDKYSTSCLLGIVALGKTIDQRAGSRELALQDAPGWMVVTRQYPDGLTLEEEVSYADVALQPYEGGNWNTRHYLIHVSEESARVQHFRQELGFPLPSVNQN